MDSAFELRCSYVENKINSKGYIPNIIPCSDFSKAEAELNDPKSKIDFFISDYNLGEGKKGIDYLLQVREKKGYNQFFILYSKNYNEVIGHIQKEIKESADLSFLNNFMTIDTDDSQAMIKQSFESGVEIGLSKWDELNAIRGEFMCENAEIEFDLRKCLNEFNPMFDYSRLVDKFFSEKIRSNRLDEIKNEWKIMIKHRNALAHSREDYHPEEGFYIEGEDLNGHKVTIYQSKIDKERKDLIELKEKIVSLIKQHTK